MSASASLIIPVTLRTPLQAYDARKIFSSTPGASDIAIDAEGGRATLQYQFPGNIDAVMRKLRRRGLTGMQPIRISVPVQNLIGSVVNLAEFLGTLNASPTVQEASFDGRVVQATIAAQTNAMRYLYEEIIIAGLMPLDVRAVAGPLEFVL